MRDNDELEKIMQELSDLGQSMEVGSLVQEACGIMLKDTDLLFPGFFCEAFEGDWDLVWHDVKNEYGKGGQCITCCLTPNKYFYDFSRDAADKFELETAGYRDGNPPEAIEGKGWIGLFNVLRWGGILNG